MGEDSGKTMSKEEFRRAVAHLRKVNVAKSLETIHNNFERGWALLEERSAKSSIGPETRSTTRTRQLLCEAAKVLEKVTPVAQKESGARAIAKLGDALACCCLALEPPARSENIDFLDIGWRHLGGCDTALEMVGWVSGSGTSGTDALWNSNHSLRKDLENGTATGTNKELAARYNLSTRQISRIRSKWKNDPTRG